MSLGGARWVHSFSVIQLNCLQDIEQILIWGEANLNSYASFKSFKTCQTYSVQQNIAYRKICFYRLWTKE